MLSTRPNVLQSLASLATFRKLALMTALLAVTTALILISTTAQAQSQGEVPNPRLSSTSPGELTISWDAPDPAPSDYRIVWAKQDLGLPSYKDANEANRGNEYPGGTETSITLTGLAKGETFRAKMRARYISGGQNNGSWSGPWTDTVTARVQDNPPSGAHRTHGRRLLRQRDPELDGAHPGNRHGLPGLPGNGCRLPLPHRPGHGQYEHRVYRLHRGCGDHLPLRGPGPSARMETGRSPPRSAPPPRRSLSRSRRRPQA